MMAFRVPWARDTRIGLFGANYEIRKQLVDDYRNGSGEKPSVFEKNAWMPANVEFNRSHPKEADIELTAFPYYESFLGGGSCVVVAAQAPRVSVPNYRFSRKSVAA